MARHNDLRIAAAAVGSETRHLRELARRDPDFADLLAEARLDYLEGLMSAAHHRATMGVDEGIFYQGRPARTDDNKPAVKVHYSDVLLIKLLEALDPRFRPHQVVEQTQSIGPDALEDLSPEEREALERFLDLRARKANPPPTFPAP